MPQRRTNLKFSNGKALNEAVENKQIRNKLQVLNVGFIILSRLNKKLLPTELNITMRNKNPRNSIFTLVLRTMIETCFIMFLFYANLLMGEYEKTGPGEQKGLLWSLNDIFTIQNFVIAIIASVIGFFVFEFLRKKL